MSKKIQIIGEVTPVDYIITAIFGTVMVALGWFAHGYFM